MSKKLTSLEAAIAEWQTAKNNLRQWQDYERQLRDQIVEGEFPTPSEGTNKKTLPDGRILKLVHSINRTLEDGPKLDLVLDRFEKAGVDVDALVTFKPSLGKKAYDALKPAFRKTLDELITSKPGSPQLTIE